MGYKIKYEDTILKEIIPENTGKSIPVRLLTLLTVFFMAAFILYNSGRNIKELLLPGNADVTQSALQGFVKNVREGEQVKDAFTDFCVEIIDNADIY